MTSYQLTSFDKRAALLQAGCPHDRRLAKALANGVNGVFQLDHVVLGRIEQIKLLAIAVG